MGLFCPLFFALSNFSATMYAKLPFNKYFFQNAHSGTFVPKTYLT